MILILALFVMVAAGLDDKKTVNLSSEIFPSITTCNYSHIPINCGKWATTHIYSILYGYREGCEHICCSYNDGDCIVRDDKSQTLLNLRRDCSGKESCTVSVNGTQTFCSAGHTVASYIAVQYVCASGAYIADGEANVAYTAYTAYTAVILTSCLCVVVAAIVCKVGFDIFRSKRQHRQSMGMLNSEPNRQSRLNRDFLLWMDPEDTKSIEDVLEKGSSQWDNCIKMKDVNKRRMEANRLVNIRKLPNQSELESACYAFGTCSETFITICDAVSEYIRAQSTDILDVWAAYKCFDDFEHNTINIVFAVITRNGHVGININDYNIYERGAYIYTRESEMVLKEVEYAQQNDDLFTDEELDELENCVSENADTLMNNHKNLNIVSPSIKKSEGFDRNSGIVYDKLCIALYVHVKGLIPIAELPFPSNIGGYPTDVLEGGFKPFNGGPYDFHEHVKMGLAIHANVTNDEGNILAGTLGGFIDHPSYGICGLTCAHVVLSGEEMEVLKQEGYINLMEKDKNVLQPIDHRGQHFGRVVSAFYTEGGNGKSTSGMEVALFKIFDRLPVDGSFPTSGNYEDIGFDDSNPMVFNTGKVCEVSKIRRRSEVYKYGISTEATRGSLGLRGSVVRTSEMSGRSQRLEYRLYNQIQVLGIAGECFALPGDSGALVFFDDIFGDSVAIGIVEGGQNNSVVFVTPLCDILSAFDCPHTMKRFIKLTSVSEDSGMFMECDETEYMDI